MHEVCQVTIIRRPTPLGDLIALRNTVDRLFVETVARPRGGWLTAMPSVAPDTHSFTDSVEARPEAEPTTEPGNGQDS
jgi:hypothetical protein